MNDQTEAILRTQQLGFPEPQAPTVLKNEKALNYIHGRVYGLLTNVLGTFNFNAYYDGQLLREVKKGEKLREDDIVEIADATGDTIVVTKGSLATFGLSEEFDEEQYDLISVKFFMSSMGQIVRNRPTVAVTEQEYNLRGTLIAEELLELMVKGFGLDIRGVLEDGEEVSIDNLKLFSTSLKDRRFNGWNDELVIFQLEKLFAEICAMVKLVDVVYGIPTDEVFREIMRSNMNKLWEDGRPRFREEDRKIIKPPHWKEPNIKGILGKAEARE